MFRIGGNTFYDWKNKILMKIPEFKRSRIGLIAECHGNPNGFPNQALLGLPHTTICQHSGKLLSALALGVGHRGGHCRSFRSRCDDGHCGLIVGCDLHRST
jgi:hypothetical protein